jgi:hypothetical protein
LLFWAEELETLKKKIRDQEPVMSGYEPLNPNNDPRVPKSISATVTQPGPTEEMADRLLFDTHQLAVAVAQQIRHVRFYPRKQTSFSRVTVSALCQERPKCVAPKPMLFDHLIGANKQRCGGPPGRDEDNIGGRRPPARPADG